MRLRAPRLATLALVLLALAATAQQNPLPILRFQRSNAYLESERAAPHAQGMEGMTYNNPGTTTHYPSMTSCMLVYPDGRYILEKIEERTVGKPKTKRSEGTFTPEELAQLKAVLEAPEFRSLATNPMPDIPDNATTMKEVEQTETEVYHGRDFQTFTITRQRMKTTSTSGLDIWIDNSGKSNKALGPFNKWMKDAEKKMKDGLKEAQPQYCHPVQVG
ncbi:MAG TPA: hypothetical protein VLA96_12970 [Terriglobales bacterium]|nr:hypothetical protein [Terriglobales bacterium]